MFKYIKVIFRGAYKILFAYPKIRKYAKNRDKYSLEERYAYARKLINIVMKAFRVEIKTEGFEKINNDETYLFVGNHQGFMDALVMIYLFDKPFCFVSKKEAREYPFVGKIIYFIEGIFFDRENLRDSVRMIRECEEKLRNNRSVVIFPEGTRTRDENHMPGEFKAGALKPAYDTKTKIVVLAMDGSYKILSTKYKKDLVVNVKVVDVIDSSVYEKKNTNELSSEIKEKIINNLYEFRKQ